jgi:DNA-binding response OmpR family regulator
MENTNTPQTPTPAGLLSTAPVSGGGKTKILIVEDERPLGHALQLKLTHEGYDVTLAVTGSEGLAQAQSGQFKLILLDMILPELDGFSILEKLKGTITTPIIVLSNLGQEEDRVRAKGLGALDYLVKSNVPLKTIVAIIHKTLGDAPSEPEEEPAPEPAPEADAPAEEATASEEAAEAPPETQAPASSEDFPL